ncbi:SLAC1 anion channel family protein [Shimia sp.]|uniref:SLAC1 anion channel family protein n=1 Tax=Shimia sp. TaxID=1954381 RepID=UPI003298F1F1
MIEVDRDTEDATSQSAMSRLMYFPVPMFACIMGLMGFSLALRSAHVVLDTGYALSQGVLWFGIAAFVIIASLYLVKLIRYPEAVMAEWRHPGRMAFFPAISIGLLLIGAAILPHSESVARIVWLVGVVLQGFLTLAVISGWISQRSFEVGQLTPAWFIPAVGNVVAPVAGVQLGYIELSWLFFSTGIVFWGVLLTLVFNRLIFHDPIPAKLLPTLVVLVAPPMVGFSAYVTLTGELDSFARILLNSGYVFAALVAVQAPKFVRLPFALSWWALSFPVAALSIASFRFAVMAGSFAHVVIGTAVLILLIIIMASLVWRTILAIMRDEICVPEM